MSLKTASDLLHFFQVGRVFSGLLPTSWGMSLITSHSSLPPSPHSSTAQQQRHITHDVPYSHSTIGPEVCRKLVPLEVLRTQQPKKQQSLSCGMEKRRRKTGTAHRSANYLLISQA